MELVNFTLNKDLIALEIDEQYLDLHNNYDFKGCVQNSSTAELKWVVAKGDWVPSSIPESLTIKIEDISYYEKRGAFTGVTDLDELGFFENSTEGKVEYNGSNTPQEGANLLLFRFIGGAELAVIGEKASCLTQ